MPVVVDDLLEAVGARLRQSLRSLLLAVPAKPDCGIASGALEQPAEVRCHIRTHAGSDVVLDLIPGLGDRVAPIGARGADGEISSLSRCLMIRRTWQRTMFKSLRPELSTSSARFSRSSVGLSPRAAMARRAAACCLVQA